MHGNPSWRWKSPGYVFLVFLLGFYITSLSAAHASPEEDKQHMKGPIIITSDTLTADNKTNTALFEKSVVARTSDMTMHADSMLVYYGRENSRIIKIEAKGNVSLIRKTQAIVSKEAVFFADENKIVFSGDPRAVEGENVVTGKKITYLMLEEQFLVEGSKVFMIKTRGQ
jgi:lipopolysaccharide export system protein LptA